MTRAVRTAVGALLCIASVSLTAQADRGHADRRVAFWDEFRDGFSVGAPDARWAYFTHGNYVADDGIAARTRDGLRVVARGINPSTREPAFVRTLAQEHENGGIPGIFDHAKWFALVNHVASSGVPGFDARPGQVLTCGATLGGRTYGTQGHPFGSAVSDPDDLRLASVAVTMLDFETETIFSFHTTNSRVYAIYERLPFARTATDDYASFTSATPVGTTQPGQLHAYRIAYDRSAGEVRWLLDGAEVFRVSQIGRRIDRAYITIDHGGTERDVAPRQMECGMGSFTLLDGYRPSDVGLVRLSDAANFYFDPDFGPPRPQTFLDNVSESGNRLFGQGAEIAVERYFVASRPARARGWGWGHEHGHGHAAWGHEHGHGHAADHDEDDDCDHDLD